MDDVRNLDAGEQEKAWNEAASDPEIGPSPQDRVEAIGRARGTARALSGIAIGIAIWGFVYPYPYSLLMITLVAMPWLAVWIAECSQGLFRPIYCARCVQIAGDAQALVDASFEIRVEFPRDLIQTIPVQPSQQYKDAATHDARSQWSDSAPGRSRNRSCRRPRSIHRCYSRP